MSRITDKLNQTARRVNLVRSQLKGTAERPRLSVHVSNMHISAQIIDDVNSKTLAGVSTVGKKAKGTMTEKAESIGTEIAKLAKTQKINKVVFDRGSKLYHGRVKALAEAARKGGLEF